LTRELSSKKPAALAAFAAFAAFAAVAAPLATSHTRTPVFLEGFATKDHRPFYFGVKTIR
jgi:hypothetical protein